MSKEAQRKEEQQWAIEKRKLDTARKLRGIHVTDLEDMEFKETNEKRAGKVGICVWNQPCPVSSRTTSAQKQAAKTPTLTDSSVHVSSTLTNLRDIFWKELCQKIMQIALQGKRSIHWVITFLCTSSLLCLKQCKTRMSEPLWTKSEESSKNCHHGK